MITDDGVAPAVHSERAQVLHKERRAELERRGGDLRESCPQVHS